MAHFVKIENNIVTDGIVISNEVCGEPTLTFPDTDAAGRAFIANTLKLDGVWKQTSFHNNFRGRYAGIGYTYDADLDEFIARQPYPSWVLDSNHDWQPPTPKPNNGKRHNWNDDELRWIEGE